jgi:hypothetical protein
MVTNLIKVEVHCYSGYRGEETPQRFVLWEKELKVLEILDQWLAPEHRYFKIKAEDNAVYILRHDNFTQEWTLTYFSKAE